MPSPRFAQSSCHSRPRGAILFRMSIEQFVPLPAAAAITTFDRRELTLILGLYGRMVALGEWRDYALDHLRDRAVFSVFRRTGEHPLYRIAKTPKDARAQGQYSVVGMDGYILKRGRDLAQVLRVFDPKLIRPVD